MVLHKLHGGAEVGLVELVGNVPAQRTELAPLLNRGVQEGDRVEKGLPLVKVVDLRVRVKNRRFSNAFFLQTAAPKGPMCCGTRLLQLINNRC